MIYLFNNIEIDTDNYSLLMDNKLTSVEPQVFNLIILLIENKDKVVSRDYILDKIWKGRVVSDTSINNHIKSARKVLGDDGIKQQVIKTIHSRGYQFVATLETLNTREEKTFIHQKAIAVLPFANIKPNLETDYLSFALPNQIIGDLIHLDGFAIRPAGSIRKYVGQTIDLNLIAQELKADYLINGSYFLENNIIRLNIELIEVDNNKMIWQESMQVDFKDTFSLQDIVAQKVAKGLDVGFRQNFLNNKRKDIPVSVLAFEYYLKGVSYPQSNEGHMLAIEMLQKSIELDPNYAPSYAHLGFHRRLLEQHGRVIPSGLHDSEWYYHKALELNPNQLEALSNLSALYTETNRIEEAVVITQRMLKINPDDSKSHFALGYVYRYAGALGEAINEMELALKISPNNTRYRSIISTYVSAGMYSEALNKVYLDNGDYGTGYSGIIAYELDQHEKARDLFYKVIKIDKNGIWGLIAQVYLAVINNDNELGLLALNRMVDTNVVDAENMFYFAIFYALLNEKDRCLNMLENAVNSGYFNYPHLSSNSSFKFIQDDLRYIDIINQAKIRYDAFQEKFFSER